MIGRYGLRTRLRMLVRVLSWLAPPARSDTATDAEILTRTSHSTQIARSPRPREWAGRCRDDAVCFM